jgi:two-component system NarL family response regulator
VDFEVYESTKLNHLKNSLETLKPDILLLDCAFPGLDGVQAVSAFRPLSKATKIIVLARHPDQKEGIIALKLGARGYCDAGSDPELIRKVVESVSKGEVWVNRNLVSDLIEELAFLTRQRGARRNRMSDSSSGH